MNEKNEKGSPVKKILTTAGILKEQDTTVGPGGGSIQLGKPALMTPGQYLDKFGTAEEKAKAVKTIEERRSRLPGFIYEVCDKCGWRMKTLFGDSDVRKRERPDYCMKCNWPGYTDGAVMRPMSDKEIRAYEKDVAEEAARVSERQFKAELYRANENRLKMGLEPLTAEQFREGRRRDNELMMQRIRKIQELAEKQRQERLQREQEQAQE